MTGRTRRNNTVFAVRTITLTIRAIGNSKGIVLPKPVLAQVDLDGTTDVAMTVKRDAIVLRKPVKQPRAGWVKAAQALDAEGTVELVMGELANQDDAELAW